MNDGDDEVGYKKPPINGQFKPGQSGNPRGRPKGSASFESLITKELGKKIAVQISGETRKISIKQAIALGIVKIALSGSPDHKLKTLNLLKTIETEDMIEEQQFDYSVLSDEELRTFAALTRKGMGYKTNET